MFDNKKKKKYNKIVIAIDQSYKRTGLSIIADGVPKVVKSIDLEKYTSNTERRSYFGMELLEIIKNVKDRADEIIIVFERIRLISQSHISENYIKATSALVARIIDIASIYKIPVYSVNTKSWKAKIVGTSNPKENRYGIDPNKYPTILFVKEYYPEFFRKLLIPATDRKSKGVIEMKSGRYIVNDDACDSLCIGLYAFHSEALLKEEKF